MKGPYCQKRTYEGKRVEAFRCCLQGVYNLDVSQLSFDTVATVTHCRRRSVIGVCGLCTVKISKSFFSDRDR
jgi:hypothetical protein